VEIQQLRHLVAAVDCGNLLKAAEECNISQSGLSRSISSLEDRLGVELLVRKSKGVEPTIFGQSIVQRARLILNEVARSLEELHALQAAEIGDVAIAITQNYSHYFLPEILADLYLSHPGIRVNVRTGGFLDLVAQLKIGAVDFVFGLIGAIGDDHEIQIEPLRKHHSRVIARSSHPLALQADEVTPADLAAARWATLSGMGFQRNFTHYFSSRGLAFPVQALKTDSIALIRRFIVGVDLLAVLPPDVVHEQVDAGLLTILNCEAPAEETTVGFVFRKHGLVTPHSRQIIDRIKRRMLT
jgi:LysR family transcriptional regulator, regulator of abg operon